MVKAYILVSRNPPIVASRGVGSAAGPRGGTGGVPGGTLIYPLLMGMGVLIYTHYMYLWGYLYIHGEGGGGMGGYLYIPTIYVYGHMLIYTMSMLYQ